MQKVYRRSLWRHDIVTLRNASKPMSTNMRHEREVFTGLPVKPLRKTPKAFFSFRLIHTTQSNVERGIGKKMTPGAEERDHLKQNRGRKRTKQNVE
ncbi:TPA: hypothetical protein EYP66_12230 [Candidatus Poribacteria bacterium]|nr:hypothetical protein [Candidatus Poribacteria bacterium]